MQGYDQNRQISGPEQMPPKPQQSYQQPEQMSMGGPLQAPLNIPLQGLNKPEETKGDHDSESIRSQSQRVEAQNLHMSGSQPHENVEALPQVPAPEEAKDNQGAENVPAQNQPKQENTNQAEQPKSEEMNAQKPEDVKKEP